MAARLCPVDIQQECNGCKGTCNVISGLGGCIQPGDSIKLSAYPAGRRLQALLFPGNYWRHEASALKFFEVERRDFHISDCKRLGTFEIRQYPVAELSPARVLDLLQKRVGQIGAYADIQPRTTVKSIFQRGSKFRVVSKRTGRASFNEDEYDVVVIATGRAGLKAASNFVDELGVGYSTSSPSIGIRLEMPAELLAPLYDCHPDFKTSHQFGAHKIKTFCFSGSSAGGGRIKYCHYHEQFSYPVTFLDGHSLYPEKYESIPPLASEFGNFGVLAQLRKDDFGPRWLDLDFCKSYYELSKGRPLYQRVRDFIDHRPSLAETRVSVHDIAPGFLSALFPTSIRKSVSQALLSLVSNIAQLNSIPIDCVLDRSTCIGPEVEFLWPTINVTHALESSVPNLYFAGDVAGIAQGNLQAAVCGAAIAEDVSRKVATDFRIVAAEYPGSDPKYSTAV